MAYQICLIEGDGIGHEVVPAARRLLEATGLPFSFRSAEAGWNTFKKLGTALPEETVETVRWADAVLFGAVSSPLNPVEGYRSPIVALRREFRLYANLRPVISQPIRSSRSNINMIIVRENTEDLYSGRERTDGNEAITERVITRQASERIARMAFRVATERRGLVTIVHKANIMRATCGLFREVAYEVAKLYPAIAVEEMLVDTTALRLVTDPEHFDVILTTNLFGDILSDEAAGLVGGLGIAPSGNIGDSKALFEPVHGSAPDIAGTGRANPVATFLAAAMLLEYLGENDAAQRVRSAVDATLRSGLLTPDLDGKAFTKDIVLSVIGHLN
jgi:homoisocitrate dehydrogenase